MFIHKQHNREFVWLTDEQDELEKILAMGIDPSSNPYHAHHKVVSKDGTEFNLFIISPQIDGRNLDVEFCVDFFRDFVLEDPWFSDIDLTDGEAEEEEGGDGNDEDNEGDEE
jgi:hypothetical protein